MTEEGGLEIRKLECQRSLREAASSSHQNDERAEAEDGDCRENEHRDLGSGVKERKS